MKIRCAPGPSSGRGARDEHDHDVDCRLQIALLETRLDDNRDLSNDVKIQCRN
jgi:hypothetical protein